VVSAWFLGLTNHHSRLTLPVGLIRLERMTSRLSGECSNQAELQTLVAVSHGLARAPGMPAGWPSSVFKLMANGHRSPRIAP
jgi:hypothetical protein